MNSIIADICLTSSLYIFYTRDLSFLGVPTSFYEGILKIESEVDNSLIFLDSDSIVAIEVAEANFPMEGLSDD